MTNLSYSSGALSTLPKFHRKPSVAYVEGQDDVSFWHSVFQALGISNLIIKPAGGATEVEKYRQSIIKDNSDIFVARDSDFRDILRTKNYHPRIIWTYGHSIKNTLYHPSSIAELISILAHTQEDRTINAEKWILNFSSQFIDLLVFEIANEKHQKGLEILGKTCVRFLQSNTSHLPSKESVIKKIEKVRLEFSNDEIRETRISLKNSMKKKQAYFIIKGHFLSHAILNFIRNEVKNLTRRALVLPPESLFANLVSVLKNQCITNTHRKDIRFLKKQSISLINNSQGN